MGEHYEAILILNPCEYTVRENRSNEESKEHDIEKPFIREDNEIYDHNIVINSLKIACREKSGF
jgi:hypothetical protein